MSRRHTSTLFVPRAGRRGLAVLLHAVVAFAVLAGWSAAAQSTLGTIRGAVNDAQGGVVPGATVVVTDEDTLVTREAVTATPRDFSRSRTCGPAPTRSPPASPVSRRIGAPAWSCVRRRSPAPTSSSKSAASKDVVTVVAEGQNITRREPGDCPRPRRAATARSAAQQPRHPGLPDAQPERRRRLRRHPVPRRTDLWRVVHPGRPAVDRGHLRRALERGTGARRRSLKCRCCPTRTAPNSVAWPASSSRPSAATNQLHGTGVLRLQLQRAERTDLRPDPDRRRA